MSQTTAQRYAMRMWGARPPTLNERVRNLPNPPYRYSATKVKDEKWKRFVIKAERGSGREIAEQLMQWCGHNLKDGWMFWPQDYDYRLVVAVQTDTDAVLFKLMHECHRSHADPVVKRRDRCGDK